jgi:hypothetical protein
VDAKSKDVADHPKLKSATEPVAAPTEFVDVDMPDFAAEEAEMKAKLGKSTWYFLHTMAAKYPVVADAAVQQQMRNFLDLFAKVYPCPQCSTHFQELLVTNPPEVS